VILDTSAVMAWVLNEPERDRYAVLLSRAHALRLSAGSWLELQAVDTRGYGNAFAGVIAEFMADFAVEIVPVSVAQAELAREAYKRYGTGTRHPARLNFGDCFAYALSKASGEPLLFKGDDFAQTDVVPAA
jgi:ribonuclease VapC